MKILNVNSYYYSSTVHRELQLALRHNDINTTTFVPVHIGYSPRLECDYLDEEWIIKAECFNKVDRLIFHIKHKKILNKFVEQCNVHEYHLLHAHSLFSNGYIALKIKKKFDIPYIVAVRDTDVNIFFKKMVHLRNLGNEILINANAIIFLSESYMKYVIENYVEVKYRDAIINKCHIIPNGINKFWLNNMNSPKTLSDKNQINLLHVGALSKRKNVGITIEAAELLINKGYDVNLISVGKIIDKRVYDIIKNKKYVTYIPQQKKEDLIKIYRRSDILVVPSKTETFGLIYPEAMSQGLPVIYTQGQGFDGQFVEGEVGYRVKSYDFNEIANKIILILDNYNLISQTCIKDVRKFDWNGIAINYKEIYKEIYNNSKCISDIVQSEN